MIEHYDQGSSRNNTSSSRSLYLTRYELEQVWGLVGSTKVVVYSLRDSDVGWKMFL